MLDRKQRSKSFSIARIGNQNAKGMTYTHSEESKKRISLAKLGIKKSKKEKLRLSESRKGTGNPNYGRKNSPETIEKMRQSALKRHQLKLHSKVK